MTDNERIANNLLAIVDEIETNADAGSLHTYLNAEWTFIVNTLKEAADAVTAVEV